MKKWMKKLALTAATLTLGANIASPAVSAQTTYDQAFFSSLSEANQSYTALKFDGTLSAKMTQNGQTADLGTVTLAGNFNAEPLQGSLTAEVASISLPSILTFSAYYQNQVAYLGAPTTAEDGTMTTEYVAYDAARAEAEFLKQFQAGLTQATQNLAAVNALSEKYTVVTETDTTYELALKENIDAAEFWTDLNAAVDLEKIKADIIAQTEAQTGETLSEEERASIDQVYSQATFEAFFKTNPRIVSVYDKETKLLQSVSLDVSLALNDYLAEGASTEDIGLPENLDVSFTLNFSEHNQAQEVTVPAEALEVEVLPLENTATTDGAATEETTTAAE